LALAGRRFLCSSAGIREELDMGTGYAVSPLHLTNTWIIPGPGRVVLPGEDPLMDLFMVGTFNHATVYTGPMRSRSPSKPAILAWRDRIAQKYRGQLGEDLAWDEDTGFAQSEDVGISDDVLLHYVAAVLDQHGETAAHGLIGTTKPPHAEMNPIFAEASRRSFGGRFPQLLLGAEYWFPFKRHMIIEEPDWDGLPARYGSLPRLMEELDEVRRFIAKTSPASTTGSPGQFTGQENVLTTAWQVSDVITRLGAIATARRLPLWTAG
jgi:hypothetical protein